MPLAAYPDLGLFVRAARILPVIAITAFAGGVLGGFVVFAINGALTPPPRPDLSTNSHATVAAAPAKPASIVSGTAPNSAVTPPPPPAAAAPAQTPVQTPPAFGATAQITPQDAPRPTRWPNALMRGRKVITPLPPPAITPAPGEAEEEKSAETHHKNSAGATTSADDDHAAARRHAHASRKRDKEFSSATAARQAGDRTYNRVYDYYDSPASDERYGARRRVRGPRPQWTQPREAAQPWSGQFWGGGGYYRDGQY